MPNEPCAQPPHVTVKTYSRSPYRSKYYFIVGSFLYADCAWNIGIRYWMRGEINLRSAGNWKQWHENTSWIIDAQCAGWRCKFGLLSVQLHTHTPPLCTWQHPTTGQAVQFWRGIPSPKMGLCWGGGGLSSIPTRHVLHLTWSHRPYLFWWISAIRQMMSEPCTLTLLVPPPSSSLMVVWWCPDARLHHVPRIPLCMILGG